MGVHDGSVMTFKAAGIWWLPNSPERGIAGTVDYVSHGPATLDLLGSWREPGTTVRLSADPAKMSEAALSALEDDARRWAAEADAEEASERERGPATDDFPLLYPVVHGVVQGHLVTLLDVLEVSRSDTATPGFTRGGFSVAAVLRGGHVGGWDDEAWSSLRLGFEHLADWCHLALLDPEAADGDDTPLGGTLSADCELPSGETLRLRFRSTGSRSLHEARHWREPEFAADSLEPRSLAYLLDVVAVPLRDLLTTATGVPCALTRIVLAGDGATWDGWQLPVEVGLADNRPAPDGRGLHPGQVPLPLDQVNFATFVPAWFRARATGAVAARFAYAQRYHRMPFGSEMLLTATAGVEALHAALGLSGRSELSDRPQAIQAFVEAFPEDERELLEQRLRGLNGPSLRTRVRDLLTLAGDLFDQVADDPRAWAAHVVGARNDVAHGTEGRGGPGRMLALAAGCGHLVELCLLRTAGVDSTRLRHRLPSSRRHAEVLDLTRRYIG